MRRSSWLIALAVGAFGCGPPAVVEAALHEDLPALARAVQARRAAGELDAALAREIAIAVAGREVRSATGEAAVRRVRAVASCAAPLVPVLEARASRHDEAGAEAALVLLQLGELSRSAAVERHAGDRHPAWRAVGARAAAGAASGALRRALFVDPDARVRANALLAAADAPDARDLDAALEAARVDPEPRARAAAARAAGAIGGDRAVLGLADSWSGASPADRVAIVEAWSADAAWPSGGARQLRRVAETTSGMPSVEAAGELVRRGDPLGLAVLLRSIHDGTVGERARAAELVPLEDPAVRAALVEASKHPDPALAIAALGRLASVPSERKAALERLRKLAGGAGLPAVGARLALAAAADRSVVPGLEAQLSRGDAHARREATRGLLYLGLYDRAATALADRDPAVRAYAACAILRETSP
ncbi:MAG: hypothetical protein IT376_08935 [Polyangiaceae bacterium]|nr:hypothetical protein [Polyangiaceae bacterium]